MLELFLMMLCKPGLRPGFKGIDDNIVVTFHSHIYFFFTYFFLSRILLSYTLLYDQHRCFVFTFMNC